MRKLRTFLLLLCIHSVVLAQKSGNFHVYDKNTIFVEILGNSGSLSLNYDRLFFQSQQLKIAGRIGYAYLPIKFAISGVPLEISVLLSASGNHHVELGTGLSYIKGLDSENSISDFIGEKEYISESLYVPFRVGYRYQRKNGGIFLKAGIVPMVSIYEFNTYFHKKSHVWFGLGLGYSF